MEEIARKVGDCIEEVIENLEDYKKKNVNKYYREEESEYCEYRKLDLYKNRSRVVDCVLGPLKSLMTACGLDSPATDASEKEIP
jgi:hypothetical protein